MSWGGTTAFGYVSSPPASRSPPLYGNSNDLTGNPFRYTGRRLDAETGLYYYRTRYYSPAIGRFLQTDPTGYGDGLNWYAYVGNDPVNKNDPSGLNPFALCMVPPVTAGCAAVADVVVKGVFLAAVAIGLTSDSARDQSWGRPITLDLVRRLSDDNGGIPVFRVGSTVDKSATGISWTIIDPRATGSDMRNILGLPSGEKTSGYNNTAKFITEGRLIDFTNVTIGPAEQLDKQQGGGPEIRVPNSETQIVDKITTPFKEQKKVRNLEIMPRAADSMVFG